MRDVIHRYTSEMQTALTLLRAEEIEGVARVLRETARRQGLVYVFGNGGSAATASHLAADLGRNVPACGGDRLRVFALTDNVPWLTAVSNDECFEDCFAAQLRHMLTPRDIVIGISASGDSENMVRAFNVARRIGVERLAMIGFDGGRLARLATQRIWVDSHDYGIVESVHSFIGHMLVSVLSRTEGDTPQSECDARHVDEQVLSSRVSNTVDVPVIGATTKGDAATVEPDWSASSSSNRIGRDA